jgi:hypothetical protein
MLPGPPAACQPELAGFQVQHFDSPRFRIDQPVFLHAVLLVKVALVDPIAPTRFRRDDFRYQVSGALKAVPDDAQAFLGHKNDVRLDRATRSQNHIQGGDCRFAQATPADPSLERVMETINDLLMKKRWRR